MIEDDISVITLDIDWAPDWVVYHAMETLHSFKVKATFFCDA
jgi:hypothetical protein